MGQCDWKRLLNEPRFARFILKSDDDAKADTEALDAELGEVRECFLKHYGDILRLFDYYCAISTNVGKAAHAIQQNSYYQMVKDCECVGEGLTLEDVQGIFVLVNYEEDKRSAQSEMNEDKALMRHELV